MHCLCFIQELLCSTLQVYTRPSVIDPLPPPVTAADGDSASKAADRQKKKGKMTDEEIMDKLSMTSVASVLSGIYVGNILALCATVPKNINNQ